MQEYSKLSESYGEFDVSIINKPQLPQAMKQHVFVTHDESTFYANDYQKYSWVEDTESYYLPKSQGRSIMIFEFQCPCHGTMRSIVDGKELTSRKKFYPGVQYQGYWTSQHMREQLENEVIPLFKALHPDSIAVFMLDQSSNHNVFALDALVAKNMNMNAIEIKDEESAQALFRDKTFYVLREYNYAEQQKMYFSKKSMQEKAAAYRIIHSKVHPVRKIHSLSSACFHLQTTN